MTIRSLEIFVTVVEEKSITRTANRLYISQPAVSNAIKEMEETYQQPLFERLSHKLYITPFGQIVYDYAKRILFLCSEMELRCNSKDLKEHIHIGCGTAIGSFMLPKIVSEFCKLNPQAEIHVTVNTIALLKPMAESNNLDILLLEEAEGFSNFIQKNLKTEPLVFICHKNHPLTYLQTVTAHDLIKEPLLLREKSSPLRNSIDYYFSKFGLNPQPLWESMDYSVLINAVSNRIGISVVPLSIYYAKLNDTITKLNVPDFDIKRTLNVFFHKDKTFSPMLNEFLEFCKIVI